MSATKDQKPDSDEPKEEKGNFVPIDTLMSKLREEAMKRANAGRPPPNA